LTHRPDVLTIDYSLNDRGLSLADARANWSAMIEKALAKGAKVILLTPSWDKSYFEQNDTWKSLESHAKQGRDLAEHYRVGLADTFATFQRYIHHGGSLVDLLSHVNHPSQRGHELIADELGKWFLAK